MRGLSVSCMLLSVKGNDTQTHTVSIPWVTTTALYACSKSATQYWFQQAMLSDGTTLVVPSAYKVIQPNSVQHCDQLDLYMFFEVRLTSSLMRPKPSAAASLYLCLLVKVHTHPYIFRRRCITAVAHKNPRMQTACRRPSGAVCCSNSSSIMANCARSPALVQCQSI
jgi:hypothetical protein